MNRRTFLKLPAVTALPLVPKPAEVPPVSPSVASMPVEELARMGFMTVNEVRAAEGLVVHLEGEIFDADQVRKLIDAVNEEARAGGRVVWPSS